MGEMFEQAMQLLGFLLFAIVPAALIFSVVEWKSNKSKSKPLNYDELRQQTNLMILDLLRLYAEKHPSMRFGQILRNTGILQDVGVRDSSKPEWETPDYYIDRIIIHEEPWTILKRMAKELDEQNKN
jgi:hypothetical protein